MPLDPSRTVAELRELQELTGDEDGGAAGRLDGDLGDGARLAARQARRPSPVEEEIDEAGNQWFTLRGASVPHAC